MSEDRVKEVQEAGENLLQWYDAIVGAIPYLSDKSEVRKAEARFRTALAALDQPQPCKTCGGCGELVDGSGLFEGRGPTTEPCPDCQPQPCKRCGGTGEVSEYNRVNPYSGTCPDCKPQQKEAPR